VVPATGNLTSNPNDGYAWAELQDGSGAVIGWATNTYLTPVSSGAGTEYPASSDVQQTAQGFLPYHGRSQTAGFYPYVSRVRYR
jgi:hypothetical protein